LRLIESEKTDVNRKVQCTEDARMCVHDRARWRTAIHSDQSGKPK
jgi:hypothetical protein